MIKNITFTWNIKKIKVDPMFSGIKDYIVSIEYDYIATDGQYTAIDSGIANLPAVESQSELDTVVEYDSLTLEQIISWMETNCFGENGLEIIQSILIKKINAQKRIPTTTEVEINGQLLTLPIKPTGSVEKLVPSKHE